MAATTVTRHINEFKDDPTNAIQITAHSDDTLPRAFTQYDLSAGADVLATLDFRGPLTPAAVLGAVYDRVRTMPAPGAEDAYRKAALNLIDSVLDQLHAMARVRAEQAAL